MPIIRAEQTSRHFDGVNCHRRHQKRRMVYSRFIAGFARCVLRTCALGGSHPCLYSYICQFTNLDWTLVAAVTTRDRLQKCLLIYTLTCAASRTQLYRLLRDSVAIVLTARYTDCILPTLKPLISRTLVIECTLPPCPRGLSLIFRHTCSGAILSRLQIAGRSILGNLKRHTV